MCFNGLNYLFITFCVFHTLCARLSFLIDDAKLILFSDTTKYFWNYFAKICKYY